MDIAAVGTVRLASGGESVIEIAPSYQDGLLGIGPGDYVQVLYWMHELPSPARKRLQAHPRGLRSPMRPNPIGVSVVQVKRVEQDKLWVTGLDAHDGSPVVDIKAAPKG